MEAGIYLKGNIKFMQELAIGIDLGCTNIKVVLIDREGIIHYQHREETDEQNDKHWKNTIAQIIATLVNKYQKKITSIGLCAPGLANTDNTSISFMPGRLPGLENFNWSDFTKTNIMVLNDAHAALMAEAKFGAAKDFKHAVMLTLGTGVGGGILIDGKLYQGKGQLAGHVGHITVQADDYHQDVTNMPGSLEDAFGNLTIQQRSKGKYQTTFELVEAYERGDTFAVWLWLSSVRKLSIGIASLINVLSPEAVIIGGGISKAGDSLLKPLRDFMNEYEWQPGGKRTEIEIAHHSDLAGAIGAAAFAISKLN